MGCLFDKIHDDIVDYEIACLVYGVKFNENDVYSKAANKLVDKCLKSEYGNRSKSYVLQKIKEGILPIKG